MAIDGYPEQALLNRVRGADGYLRRQLRLAITVRNLLDRQTSAIECEHLLGPVLAKGMRQNKSSDCIKLTTLLFSVVR
jgi:hypothetical protein